MISRMAIRRIIEDKRAEDPDYDKEIRLSCPSMASMKQVTDSELLQRLKDRGIEVDKNWMDQATTKYLAAYQIADAFDPEEEDSDMVWLCLDSLLQRWFPDRHSFELIDEWMQQGYSATDQSAKCELWKQVWDGVLNIMQRASCRTIDEFDTAFGGTQSVFNWVQDYETELLNQSQKVAATAQQRIELCEPVINGLSTNTLLTEYFQRSLAEAYFSLGEFERATALYERWLTDDPQWGWGWIDWSDNYFIFSPDAVEENPDFAIELLKRGLNVPNVRDRSDLLDRLASVLEDTGRVQEAQPYRDQIAAEVAERRSRTVSVPMATPGNARTATRVNPFGSAPRGKVGRNEPCPCNSGRKFKKCCGRNST